MYNEVLALPVPEEAMINVFPDDLAVVIIVKHVEDV